MYLQWDCYAICVHKIVMKFNFASLIQGQFWHQKNVQYFSFYDSPAALQDRILSTLLPLLGSPQLTGAVKLVPGTEPSSSRVLVTSSTLVLVVVTMLLLLLALVPGPPASPRIRHHPLLPVPVLRVRGPRVRRLRRLLRPAPRTLLHPAVAAADVARLGLSSG